ncbi:ATP synthase F(0) complex subunit B1, mitochondrial isoform X2 [Phyllopteryx taeniolatus]|uniref:ATP synthase F(0) complex subunit B1, mitochondrial isoform X2 n=1 Tax=Phyllopteryx taeniolatus TaxID=161469 RepID=UPI002AD4CC4A|nr:ATP synthase F(0) complex subunit B1, mitochondrial isoform X2 [Phyllopteryx taeniolatus]
MCKCKLFVVSRDVVGSSRSLRHRRCSLQKGTKRPKQGARCSERLAPSFINHAVQARSHFSVVQASRSLHSSSQSLAPVPSLPEKGGKVRHGIIPEELFQLLYPKTGVTGPYMLGTGLLIYMLSKEIYVINHETFAAASIGAVIIYGIRKFGPSVAAFADKLNEDKVAKAQEVKDLAMSSLTQATEDEKKEQWRVEGRSMLFDAKRNNVAMLLETNYRERLHTVTNEVKRRLDYQIALQNLQHRMAQEHMVNWVEKNVVSSITPQQEKESIAKCLTDLKALAKATHAKATA